MESPELLTNGQREAYVRKVWEQLKIWPPDNDCDCWILRLSNKSGVEEYFEATGSTKREVITAAYDFTRKRESEIAELDEEIEWMHAVLGKCSDYVPPMKRILEKHLLPARAALVKGFKETV